MSESEQPNLPPHRQVRVDLGPRAYDVVIGRGLLLESFYHFFTSDPLDSYRAGSVALITDKNLERNWGFPLKFAMDYAIVRHLFYWVQAGESAKSIDQYSIILKWLASEKFTRKDLVVAVGGGVIGDLAGFVAASYLRGINFVQVPTTLLAMVDSSVGGKTGVNLPEGKNLVGAFHQPKLVVADLDTLVTLPAREFSAGMAEVIKYGAIRDKVLFERVSKQVKSEDADLDEIVEKCVSIKARIVETDEFETKGERALLNFGHTIGHAIEKVTGYNTYLHGEAISLGMRAAAWLSVWHSGLPEADARRIEAALATNNLPLVLKPEVDRAAILAALGNDKKVAADGKNRWVLLKSLGEATSGHELPGDLVEKAVNLLTKPI